VSQSLDGYCRVPANICGALARNGSNDITCIRHRKRNEG
jgi:hypothetical protein